MLKITNKNYFSNKISQIYTGSTEIKNMMQCESRTIAALKNQWVEDKTDALLTSSYLDEKISGTLDDFVQDNPELFTKKGDLKSQYKHIEDIYNEINNERNSMFKKYLSGKPQVIMIGEISGVPVKIKIDSFHLNKCIVDLKCVKDFKLIYNEKTKVKENFIDYYSYTIQGALYQEIVRQNTGKQLPFIIAACTKEKYPRFALLQIPQEKLDLKLQFLQSYLPHLQDLKQGKIEPVSCNCCDYCISKQKVDRIWYYDEFFGKEE